MPTTEKALIELSKVVELFQSQQLTETCRIAYINSAGKPSARWSFSNQIIMLINGTQDARGYRQWQEIGRYVKAGAKAFYILGPCTVLKEVDKSDGTKDKVPVITGFRGIPVFRFEDTEGKPIEEYRPKEIPPLMSVAAKWNIKVRYDGTSHGEYGYYSLDNNEIVLSSEDMSVFLHELVHAAHKRIEPLKGGQDQEQEAIAELTAAVLSRLYGHNVDAFAWQYIAHYAGGKTPEQVGRLCLRVLAKVSKILTLILETEQKQEVPPLEVTA